MFRQMLVLSAAVLAAVAVAAGCGDDDSGASDGAGGDVTTSSLSKEQFVERANAICERRQKQQAKEFNAYLAKTQKENPDASSTRVFAGVAATVALPTFQGIIDTLRQLGAPEGDEEELEALLTEMQQGVDTLKRRLPAEARQLEQGDRFFETLDSSAAMARRYGIGACALS